ncbi:MAG: hypothetical protein J5855_05090 [Mailhella sp.]|nr:hypothetical protein [Mailhella sp.]
MNKTTVLNPQFEALRGFVETIDTDFPQEGTVVYRRRNTVKRFDAEPPRPALFVKSYGIPNVFNRVIYRFFRLPKAERAYRHTLKILELGFESPAPVAYVLFTSPLTLGRSYYISKASKYGRDTLDMFYKHGKAGDRLAEAFALFTARLHKAGVMHLDYSSSNILYGREKDGWHFSLIDTNRMRFLDRPLTMKEGCRNLVRITAHAPQLQKFIDCYAEACGYPKDECAKLFFSMRKRYYFMKSLHFHPFSKDRHSRSREHR